MPEVCCYVCAASGAQPFATVGGYEIFRCPRCRLYWVANLPSAQELAAFYSAEYYEGAGDFGYDGYCADEENHRRNARWMLDTFAPPDLSGQRVLDFGCSVGFFLDEARQRGAETFGVESSAFAREASRALLAMDLAANLEELEIPPGSIDSVWIIGVIEHLPDPRKALQDLRRLLKPGGLLITSTIDTEGWLPLYALKPPEHLIYFSNGNYSRLLEGCGYSVRSHQMYWVSYHVDDVLNRLAHHFSVPPFRWAGNLFAKTFGSRSIRIPTNEFVMAAENSSA